MGIRRRVLRLVRWAAVVAGIIVFASYRYADFPFAAATLGKEWERAKKNGIALESKDLLPDPAVPDGDNAALVLIPLAEQADASVKAAKGRLG